MHKEYMKFNWDIIGHKKQVDYLQKQIFFGKIYHAYLFVGPANLGKSEVCKYFINSLLCEKDDKPCFKCQGCRQIKKGIYPDIYQIKPEKKDTITVVQIRELRKKFSQKPWHDNWQIAIINQADLMNITAANALLKTLEEPNEKRIIILLTENFEKIPKTIISRCQIIKFFPIPRSEIQNYLLNNISNQKQVLLITQLANGYPEIAKDFIKNPKKIKLYQKKIEQYLNLFLQNEFNNRLACLSDLTKNNELIKIFINISAIIWRDTLLIKNAQEHLVINHAFIRQLSRLAKKYTFQNINEFMKQIDKINKNRSNINLKLALENIIINYSN